MVDDVVVDAGTVVLVVEVVGAVVVGAMVEGGTVVGGAEVVVVVMIGTRVSCDDESPPHPDSIDDTANAERNAAPVLMPGSLPWRQRSETSAEQDVSG